jgi:hypothetical protein
VTGPGVVKTTMLPDAATAGVATLSAITGADQAAAPMIVRRESPAWGVSGSVLTMFSLLSETHASIGR